MSIYKELSYENDISKIKGIRFCLMSPDEIEKNSVAEIYKTETYNNNEPVANGLFDSRMGVIDHNKYCQTCEEKNTFCPGHFGHINLVRPMFYIQFFDTVKKILKCVCFRCSSLLINKETDQINAILNKKFSRQKRWELIYKLTTKAKKCSQCNAKQPDKITKEPIIQVVMSWKDPEEKITMNAEDILLILKRITEEDSEILGFSKNFNRPDWLVCTKLIVPPPTVRPSVRTDTGQRSEDDLTHKICDIIKSNNALKTKIENNATKEQIDIASQVLQYHIATLIDNKIPGINPAQQRTGRLLKSVIDRLKSKDGRVRGNLMGKRVDFSARSVITPDPNLSIDELGVPLKIAMNLTFPEIVNDFNRKRLMKYITNGPDVYPGAKFIRKGKWTKTLKNMPNRDKIELENGDIVDRYLIDGDVVLFNRQPSLHKYSMLCHRIKVINHNTFRMNVLVTPCFNSDFDGDEMNMHVPQSITTASEIYELSAVYNHVISVRECKPIISVVQDIALGIYRLTKNNVFLTQKQFFNLIAPNMQFTGYLTKPKDNKWSGKQLISTIIPKNINLRTGNKSYTGEGDNDNFVIIKNGELVQGTLDKTIYQTRSKGLVHSIFNDCGAQENRLFLDNTQKLICDWLVYSGFSVGVSDLLVNDVVKTDIHKSINNMKVEVYKIISDIHKGEFKNDSISNNNDNFELEVNKILNQAISTVGKLVLKNLDGDTNRMISMINSGSKGSIINVSQMIACLGQQNIEGKRIPYGFDDRTLPHYSKFDDSPSSRGFIENSFIKGLTPQEFFFHSMGGREGLIDTAVKTSSVGYLQRKLIKAMEDCKVSYDYTVRNSAGFILQFLYGEDGMDACKLESQPMFYINMNYLKLKEEYYFDTESKLNGLLTKEAIADVLGKQDRFDKYFEQVQEDREFIIIKIFNKMKNTNIMYPISFVRLLNRGKSLVESSGGIISDLSPIYVLDKIEELSNMLFINKNNYANKFIKILLRMYLSPKKITYHYKFNKTIFDYIIQQIIYKFNDAIINPSEMVGVVAAQSIGEGITQLSCDKDTKIIITGNESFNGPISEFIDKLIVKNEDSLIHLNNNSVVLDLKEDYNIMGVSHYEKTSWKKISQVSRHLANGNLIKVTTKSGRTTTATLSHSFLKRSYNTIVPIKGSDLRLGDRIPIVKHIPEIENSLTEFNKIRLTNSFGWRCGQFIILDDVIDDNEIYKLISKNSPIPCWIYQANINFISGFLRGLYDNKSILEKSKIILDIENITDDVMILLTYFDIFSVKENNKCVIYQDYFEQFKKKIQFQCNYSDIYDDNYVDEFDRIPSNIKNCLYYNNSFIFDKDVSRKELLNYIDNNVLDKLSVQLLEQAIYSDIVWDEIVELKLINDTGEYVYDFTVPGNDSFMVDNCVLVHNTLNTFHSSGVSSASNIVRGVPRIQELLSVSKNLKSPSLTIYIDELFNQDKMKCKKIMESIQSTRIKDIIISSKIYFDPNDFETTIENDRDFVDTYKHFTSLQGNSNSPWLLRFEFNKNKLYEYGIYMIDIYHKLKEFYDELIDVMFSDDNSANLIFRIKLQKQATNNKKDDSDNEPEAKDVISDLKALEKSILDNVIVKGIKSINKTSMYKLENEKYNDTTMDFDKKYEWIINTDGTNLLDIFSYEYIDKRRTISNDIVEIYNVLGIEAAKQALYNELWDVILGSDMYVNYRHIILLTDVMTSKGYLMSIDRHGINRSDIGPLTKSSFEETSDMLIKAGIFGELDRITGVSANIMLGQIPSAGTGDTDILIDELKLKENTNKQIIKEDVLNCNYDYLDFKFDISKIMKNIKIQRKNINIIIK
jgi:DNA-directed RNA polymerase beta' subunit